MAGRKISNEPDFNNWFLAKKPILGIKRTPEASQRKCPGTIKRAFKELTLWPEVKATKNARLQRKQAKRRYMQRFERNRSQNYENSR